MLFGNARTLGKHRRPVLNPCIEPQSLAKCVRPEFARCMYTFCPRHDSANYATLMARHATDSI